MKIFVHATKNVAKSFSITSRIFPGVKKNNLQDGSTRSSRGQYPFGFGDIFRETGKKGYENDIANESCGFMKWIILIKNYQCSIYF